MGTGQDTSFAWSLVGSCPRIVEMAEEVLGFFEHFHSLQASPSSHKATAASQPLSTGGRLNGGWGRPFLLTAPGTQLVSTPGPLQPARSSGEAPWQRWVAPPASHLVTDTLVLFSVISPCLMCLFCSSCPVNPSFCIKSVYSSVAF